MHVLKLLVGLLLVITAWAASPVGSVKSAADFELRGATVNTAGVPSWPVMPGDVIASHNSVAVIQLTDGSRVTLDANSRAKVEAGDDGLSLHLVGGSMIVTRAAKSSARFYSGDSLVKVVPNVETAVAVKAASGQRTLSMKKVVIPPQPPRLSRY